MRILQYSEKLLTVFSVNLLRRLELTVSILNFIQFKLETSSKSYLNKSNIEISSISMADSFK